MPRRRLPPRLYFDEARGEWVIREGQSYVRTGCAREDIERAKARLHEYLGDQHQPEAGPNPLIADVLLAYTQGHVVHIAGAKNTSYNISNLAPWWGAIRVDGITAARCRQYAGERSRGGARRDLEVLRAAVRWWAREKGLSNTPTIVLPPKGQPRERWLTKSEAARLLWEARREPHLRGFILVGLYTGSRRHDGGATGCEDGTASSR